MNKNRYKGTYNNILPLQSDSKGQNIVYSIEQASKHRYQIQGILGKQTGRRTYVACDRTSNQQVVIKCILFGADFRWQELKLFERETETLRALKHPTIPRYLDFFEVEIASQKNLVDCSPSRLTKEQIAPQKIEQILEQSPEQTVLEQEILEQEILEQKISAGFALVQSYIPAPSLQTLVSAGRRFSETDLKRIAQSLLTTLHYLHSAQPSVIHRDIKPSNILLSIRPDRTIGRVYLVDFGAVQTVKTDGTMTVVGTYGYMPPEQFGGHAKPASDLYGLGTTLIYLATSEHPSTLLQDNLQITFENRVSLSTPFTQWLKQLTYAELSRRTATAAQALSQLTLPQTAIKVAAPSSIEPITTHGQFRAIAQHHSQQDFQLYTHSNAFEIELPLRHIKKSPSIPFQPSMFNGKGERNLVFLCVALIVITPYWGLTVALWPAALLFLMLMTSFSIAIQSPRYNASIKLFYDAEGRLRLNLAAPVSRDMNYPHPVPIRSELNPLRLENVRLRAAAVTARNPPRLSTLTFILPPNEYTTQQELTVLASRHQLQWIAQHFKRWRQADIDCDKSWKLSFERVTTSKILPKS